MKTTRISPTRLLLEFPSQKEMNLSMFRISEFYEGDDALKGQLTTPDEFLDRWTDKRGEMKTFGSKKQTYFAFWDGYNIPMHEVIEWARAFKSHTSVREKEVLAACMTMPKSGYLITCVEGDKTTIRHEMAHGHFYENPSYQNAALDILTNRLSTKTYAKYVKGLKAMNYTPEVFQDETQAYLVAYDREEHREVFPTVTPKEIAGARYALGKLFDDTR